MLGFVGLSLLAWVASASVAAANIRGWFASLVSPLPLPDDALLLRSWGLLAVLYVATAVAAWQVWRQPLATGRQRTAMNFWGWQLALGAAWPAAFFGLHLLFSAMLLAAGLVACAALTLWRFAGLDRMAGILLAPYFAFTVAVFYVNAGFWWLNHP